MTIEELQARVEARWREFDRPSWPPPRPIEEPPRDEEYSRATDPGRYRIVHERAHVWTTVLSALPGISATALEPGPLDTEGHLGTFDRGVQVSSSRPGTLPLLLLERDARGADTVPVLHIAAAEPNLEITAQPDCGCDACDCGSEDLLRAIDEAIRPVIDGPIALLRGPGWKASWHPGGGSSGGSGRGPDHAKLMELCRRLAAGEVVRLPRKTQAWVGQSWLT